MLRTTLHIKSELLTFTGLLFASVCMSACSSEPSSLKMEKNSNETKVTTMSNAASDTVTFGAGCFWCVEAIFQRLKGVESVKSGYSGGTIKNPSYKEVCNGTTGHAEVCQLVYNKAVISFEELLEVFWKTHDPTTLNRQGNDYGTQYRSAIFYHNEEQKILAEKYKAKLNDIKAYENPIVTEITAFSNFYPAEDYHQNYFNANGSESYCRFVIQPKVEKFEKVFKDKVKH
ncbi:MAG: peptide-methionine (S)-S-oxide reductase MsrA [Bacteroidia bacterium]|nr:peptide-methionine (S)-S-oxide reductase MsrA [Bacteroidia bacterium]